MPIKRKIHRRKFPRRKRFVRKSRVPRPFGRPSLITRGAYYTGVTSPAAAPTFFGYEFKLTDLPDYTEFTNLFDEYKIMRVKVYFLPNVYTQNTSIANLVPWFLITVDKDDSSAPTSFNSMLSYPGCKITSMQRKQYVSFVPRVATAVYGGPVVTSYGSKSMYLDCGSPGVPHYGLKIGVGNSTNAGIYGYHVFVKYVISFRGVR